MDTIGTTTSQEAAGREAASRMAAAAAAWLDALEPAQRAVATGGVPSADAESDAERRRWFYTPTDHGGLTLGAQRPAQQRLAYQLVASGLSVAGYRVDSPRVTGVNVAGLYLNTREFSGMSLSAYNRVRGLQRGVTIGIYNSAYVLKGIQVGVLNRAKNNRGIFRILPVLNAHL